MRDRKTSASSSKVMKMSDSPKRLSLRIEIAPGTPLSARSSGTVRRRSISSGARPGICPITLTWRFVTSGNASIGVRRYALTP